MVSQITTRCRARAFVFHLVLPCATVAVHARRVYHRLCPAIQLPQCCMFLHCRCLPHLQLEIMSQHFHIWRDKQTIQGSCQKCIWKDKQNQGKNIVLESKTKRREKWRKCIFVTGSLRGQVQVRPIDTLDEACTNADDEMMLVQHRSGDRVMS